MRYFIGNWKMFGVPKSINILNKINYFYSKDKNRQKYRVVITPPYTLIQTYAKYFQKKNSGFILNNYVSNSLYNWSSLSNTNIDKAKLDLNLKISTDFKKNLIKTINDVKNNI